ncbi:MAG: sporulation initiation factor Spo0A C-terminal domain-containing protein [Akkermansia sp.]|nr:sporulation initiation factor Spo0A C-terminal domain-containing protein [Akkermansia sp.]
MINEQKLDNVLLTCGLRDNLLGTDYTRRAVRLYRPGMSITKELYPAIAAAASTSPSRVERAIRHAIESGFDRSGYTDEMLTMFGNTIDPATGKLTNGEFVARVARICREGLPE